MKIKIIMMTSDFENPEVIHTFESYIVPRVKDIIKLKNGTATVASVMWSDNCEEVSLRMIRITKNNMEEQGG